MKIKSCIDSTYMVDEYPIHYELDGQLFHIATFKALNESDINKVLYKTYNDGSRGLSDGIQYNNHLAVESLVWWVFDSPISDESFTLLKDQYRNHIIDSILSFMNSYNNIESPYYVNIDFYVKLIENKDNIKHLHELLNNRAVIEPICSRCELYQKCDSSNMPKILPITRRACGYAYNSINSNGANSLSDMNWESVPTYLINFVNYAISKILAIRASNKQSEDS